LSDDRNIATISLVWSIFDFFDFLFFAFNILEDFDEADTEAGVAGDDEVDAAVAGERGGGMVTLHLRLHLWCLCCH
jgi:hypothetical protein